MFFYLVPNRCVQHKAAPIAREKLCVKVEGNEASVGFTNVRYKRREPEFRSGFGVQAGARRG